MTRVPINLLIRKARLDLQMGQQKLAALVGKTQSAISQFELGRPGVFSADVVAQLCKHVGVDPANVPPQEMDLQEGEEEVLAFCPNYDCPDALCTVVLGKLQIRPPMYFMSRGLVPVHCPSCGFELSDGCPTENCLTELVRGASACVGCGQQLVKPTAELSRLEPVEVADEKKERRQQHMAMKDITLLPKPRFKNPR